LLLFSLVNNLLLFISIFFWASFWAFI